MSYEEYKDLNAKSQSSIPSDLDNLPPLCCAKEFDFRYRMGKIVATNRESLPAFFIPPETVCLGLHFSAVKRGFFTLFCDPFYLKGISITCDERTKSKTDGAENPECTRST